MKVVCAWCDKIIGYKPPYRDKSTSHGMCKDCKRKLDNQRTLTARNPFGSDRGGEASNKMSPACPINNEGGAVTAMSPTRKSQKGGDL